MPNKSYSKFPSKGGETKAMGSAPDLSMPIRTASWPGLPGPASKSRAAGTPETGCKGMPFYPKKQGM